MSNVLYAKLPLWQSHKRVRAAKIKAIRVESAHPYRCFLTLEGLTEPVVVEREWWYKHVPREGGYYVVYDDDYVSYSPVGPFEAGYTLVTELVERLGGEHAKPDLCGND